MQSLLSRLTERGFLKTGTLGKNKTFEPLVSEDEYLKVESMSFFKRFSRSGTITGLVTALYDNNTISEKDIEELDAFIEAVKKEGK